MIPCWYFYTSRKAELKPNSLGKDRVIAWLKGTIIRLGLHSTHHLTREFKWIFTLNGATL